VETELASSKKNGILIKIFGVFWCRLLVGLRDFSVSPQRKAQKPDVETHQSARSPEGTRLPREEERRRRRRRRRILVRVEQL
jgi:hypothetical protein